MIKKTIFIFLTICIIFLSVEIGFRILFALKYRDSYYLTFGLRNVFRFDVSFMHGYLKLEQKQDQENQICYGFRTEPFDLKKPSDEYRIVALGGSSTYGLGKERYSDCWPYILQMKLNNALKDHHYKVINAGVPSQTTYGVDRLLTDEIFVLSPDVVIIYSLYNIMFIDTPMMQDEGKLADFLFRYFRLLFQNKSLVGTYLIEKVGLFEKKNNKNKMDTYRYLLIDMIEKCRAHNVKIIIVKQLIDPKFFRRCRPDSCTRDGDTVDSNQYYEFLKIIDDVHANRKCEVVDFSASSPVCKGKLPSLLVDGVHLTESGEEALAEELYKKIAKKLS